MVAVPDIDSRQRVSSRILRMLRDVQLPGDVEDHAWMGERIQEAAVKLTDRFPCEFGQDLIVSGLALDLGLDVTAIKDLEGWCFPESWLQSVPRLLQCGFPKAAWNLVESGVLSIEWNAVGARFAWRLDLTRISRLTGDCFELGNDRIVRLLAEGIMGVSHGREQDTRIRVVSGSLQETREWVREMSEYLRETSGGNIPHLVAG